MLKKIIRITLKTLGIIIGILALYALAAWLIPYIPVNKKARLEGPDEVTIYIKSNGVHTDIVVPVKTAQFDWTKYIKYEHTDDKDSTMAYVGIGWGDKGFYLQTPQWSDLKFSTAFKAMFYLSTSALHATFYPQINEGENCKAIQISYQQYEALNKFLVNSFDLDAGGNTVHIPSVNDGYGSTDAFYEAKGRYSLFYSCNTWANNALKAAEQKACLWTVTDKGIFYQYK
ncbi:TIGR02117 family protein [Terrimonas rubra]|uniref:TIGR02117 family protein n=1 Tax=Terrimonas rubra TaxID=1035890 RepID=A0ABW6A2H6_9BACT